MPYVSRALVDGRRDPDLIAKAELHAMALLCAGVAARDVTARTGLRPGHVRLLTAVCREEARTGPPAA
jgi:hypothetical protein